jgi:hypothetical protein
LQDVLDDELYERWYKLKLQQVITSQLEDVVYCPRCEELGHETPVMASKPDSPDEAPLAKCGRCDYLFCGKCMTDYHHSIKDCVRPEQREAMKALRKEGTKLSPYELRKLAQATKGFSIEIHEGIRLPLFDAMGCLTEDWEPASEGDQIMVVFEMVHAQASQKSKSKSKSKRAPAEDEEEPKKWNDREVWNRDTHTPDTLERALNSATKPLKMRLKTPKNRAEDRLRQRKIMEELMTLKALRADSQNCPKCHALVVRSAGCNHISCHCGTHFCYKCGKQMDPADPYAHFKEGTCQTFDPEEVQRLRDEQRRNQGMDEEMLRLREQYGDQAQLFAMLGVRGVAAPRPQQRQLNNKRCPTCGHWNARTGNLNQIRCPNCRTSFCYVCEKRIQGNIPAHYRGEGACPMHSQ